MPTRPNRFAERLAAKLSAKQTAALCLCGGLISASGCLAVLPLHTARHHHTDTAFWIWAGIGVSLMILGFAILFFARNELESGIATNRWPEAEIESLRNLTQSPFSTAVVFALFLAMIALLVISRRSSTPAYWSCFILVQAITQLSMATRAPRETPTTWLGASNTRWSDDTASLAPIQSEHWGNR
jgi:drug/metabolite transporter (DMT)-like permease